MAERNRKSPRPGARKKAKEKKKTAVIFQGGAARGAHQVGAMQYLDELGIKPDLIIGSSIGVINACLYLTGGVEQMVEFWSTFSVNPFVSAISFRDNVFMRNSLLSMRKAYEKIESYFDFEKIFRSRTEACFTLTNLSEGTAEIRSNRTEEDIEDFRTITRIGYTIPGLFAPVEFEGDYWCDGGFVWSAPFEYALGRGANRVYVLLCIGRTLPRKDSFGNLYHVMKRFYDVMWIHVGSREVLRRDFTDSVYADADVHIIEPSSYLDGFGFTKLLTFDPSRAKRYIKQGYDDAIDQLGNVK